MRLLFVYGTLQRGGIWHYLPVPEAFVGRDTVTGALHLHPCGAYPVILPGDRAVPGEVFRVGPAAFEQVARLEAGEYAPREVMTGAGRSGDSVCLRGRVVSHTLASARVAPPDTMTRHPL